jgi:hypothetical protein
MSRMDIQEKRTYARYLDDVHQAHALITRNGRCTNEHVIEMRRIAKECWRRFLEDEERNKAASTKAEAPPKAKPPSTKRIRIST